MCSCSNLLSGINIGDFVTVETTCGTKSGTLKLVTNEMIQLN